MEPNSITNLNLPNYKIGLCGFRNIGNTCYMNSILQLLLHTRIIFNFLLAKSNPFVDPNTELPFNELVKQKLINAEFVDFLEQGALFRLGEIERKKNKLDENTEITINKTEIDNFIDNSIILRLAEIINIIVYKGNSEITPNGFKHQIDKKIPSLRGWGQQDSHELLNGLLDIFIEETGIESEPSINNVPQSITDYINLLQNIKIRILNTKNTEEKKMIINELNEFKKRNFDVINKYNGLNYMTRVFKRRYNPMIYKLKTFMIDTLKCQNCHHENCNYQFHTILMLHIKPTLKECFDQMIEDEIVDRKCEICECRKAIKKTRIWRPGMILYIELCRFINLPNGRTHKLNSYVDIPDILDISEYCDTSMRTDRPNNTYKYKLKGMSNHMGDMGGGHYTANCVGIVDDKTWYHFDDSRVGKYPDSNIDKSSAYVLLYEMTE